MAVYTEVADDELRRFIATYDIGALWSYKGIAEGTENSNFLVHTETGPFILTLYEKRVHPADLPYFLGLMEHLSEAGVRCPLPVRDRKGNMLRQLAGRPTAMVTFLEGVSAHRPNVEHCALLGASLGQFHVSGLTFRMRRGNDLSLAGWQALAERIGISADEIAPGLTAEIEQELAFLTHHWPRNLPEGVIHADLFPDNVLFLESAVSGFIDFYFACNDLLAYDLAVCLNAWCFEPDCSFNVTKAQAMLERYVAARPLTPMEIDALPLLARGAALRFLLTRSYDWLNPAPDALVKRKDPIEYVRKLRFHQRIGSAAEYGLIPA